MKLRAGTIHKAINPASGLVISVKGAKEKAWKATSLLVRKRDPICVTCKVRPTTQCGHWKHNSDKPNQQLGGNALWYDLRNLAGQCTVCNCYNSGELDEFGLYLEEKHGFGILQELQRLYNTPKKWTILELLQLAEERGG